MLGTITYRVEADYGQGFIAEVETDAGGAFALLDCRAVAKAALGNGAARVRLVMTTIKEFTAEDLK